MGMAASQARYLALTARKSNVEYEGQQINQQRTALANQSANAFNELLALEVPTVPSTSDYTTIQYSYEDGTTEETISDMTPLYDDEDGYNYLVTHYYYADVYTGIESKKSNPQVVLGTKATENTVSRSDISQDDDGNYTINGYTVNSYDSTDEEQSAALASLSEEYADLANIDEENLGYYIDDDGTYHFLDTSTLSGDDDITDYSLASNVPTYVGNYELSLYDSTDEEQQAALAQIREEFPDSNIASASDDEIYTWEENGVTYFACLADLYATATSGTDSSLPTENQSKLLYYNAEYLETKISTTEKAFVDFDDSGRAETIRYEDSSATFTLTTETITDDDAYEDAMNQYYYEYNLYEKAIEDINAKTEKIQQQDKTLELRLRQLDTEQEALQTEMEAVAKVIEKNIESTFKTFE